MKNILKLALVAVALLVFSCNKSDKDEIKTKNAIIGAWTLKLSGSSQEKLEPVSHKQIITYYENGTFKSDGDYDKYHYKGTYKIEGNKLIEKIDDGRPENEYQFSISGNKLTTTIVDKGHLHIDVYEKNN